MGQYANTNEDYSIEDQIRALGDEELLDFWQETQELAKMITQKDTPNDLPEFHPEYERLILQELQLRTGMKQIR